MQHLQLLPLMYIYELVDACNPFIKSYKTPSPHFNVIKLLQTTQLDYLKVHLKTS